MSNPLLPIPGNLALPDLVTALNDRIRRINETATTASSVGSSSSGPKPTSAKAVVSSGGAAQILYGTHAYRVATGVTADQSLYVETDRNNLIYQVQATVWTYLAGTYEQLQSALTGLASTLGPNDTGLLVYTTDTLISYRWSGSAFVQLGRSPVLSDTHANRLSTFPSTLYTADQEFFETDRTVRFIAEDATGTVTVTGGTTVTWNSGNKFDPLWPALSTQIVIAGVPCFIFSVVSATVITLVSAAANGAGVAYKVTAGRWIYTAGVMETVLASLPADLGANDTGLLVNVTDASHVLLWNGSAFVAWTGLASTNIWVGDASAVPQAVAVSGDATLANTGALTLAASGATPGTYGDATHVAQIAVDAKGRVTLAANVAISQSGPTPTLTLGNGAGVGATYTISGSPYKGLIQIFTAGVPAAGQYVFQMNLATGAFAVAPTGTLFPANSAVDASSVLLSFDTVFSTAVLAGFVAGTPALTTGKSYEWVYILQ